MGLGWLDVRCVGGPRGLDGRLNGAPCLPSGTPPTPEPGGGGANASRGAGGEVHTTTTTFLEERASRTIGKSMAIVSQTRQKINWHKVSTTLNDITCKVHFPRAGLFSPKAKFPLYFHCVRDRVLIDVQSRCFEFKHWNTNNREVVGDFSTKACGEPSLGKRFLKPNFQSPSLLRSFCCTPKWTNRAFHILHCPTRGSKVYCFNKYIFIGPKSDCFLVLNFVQFHKNCY